MTIRHMVESDADWAAALMEQRREEYAAYSPVFWRPAANITDLHASFLRLTIARNGSIALRSDDGFAISTLDRDRHYVDDFGVGDGDWDRVGADLLEAVWANVAPPAAALRVVTARLDEPKVTMLAETGLTLHEQWWVRPVEGPTSHPSGVEALDGTGYHVHCTAAPRVYDPGGPVGILTAFDDAPALQQAEAAAAAAGVVLLIAPLETGSAREATADGFGFEVASRFYAGIPTGR